MFFFQKSTAEAISEQTLVDKDTFLSHSVRVPDRQRQNMWTADSVDIGQHKERPPNVRNDRYHCLVRGM